MIVDLRLQQFRSFRDASFEFGGGVNIIVGPNASGKTNLLEAILVLARGSSYRAKDADLVMFRRKWARLGARLADDTTRTVKLTPGSDITKQFELNNQTYKKISSKQALPVVLFEPEHLRLLSGGPQRRRDYLDDFLEQTTAGYGTVRRQYRRTLGQRNTLLKQDQTAAGAQLFAWDVQLSQLAGQIVRARQALAGQINGQLPDLYKKLSGTRTAVSVKYLNSWPIDTYESHLLKKLEASTVLDRQRGFTGAGPHREDLLVLFDGHPAQEVASRGEVRTAVLALKIIELKIIEAARETPPLLLLDDVFSELDGRRRRALTEHLASYQTFITTTDADLVTKQFTTHARITPLDLS